MSEGAMHPETWERFLVPEGGPLAPGRAAVPTAGPGTALATVRPWASSSDHRRAPSEAAAVLDKTDQHWFFQVRSFVMPSGALVVGAVPVPRPGWLRCGFCAGTEGVILRAWRFHTRPGNPSVPGRCDVDVKCGGCAAGWWHGVAVSESDYAARPMPTGLRAAFARGSNFEPKLWASTRHGSRRASRGPRLRGLVADRSGGDLDG